MSLPSFPWYVLPTAAALLVGLVSACVWWWVSRRRRPPALPDDWSLSARPVFSADERRVYRLLREALPHHVILSKLPLVRFSHPKDPAEVRYWYDLLGAAHVTFAVCSANGRVLAALDLEGDRGQSARSQKIKQSVLAACRIRYLRCPLDHLPSVAELQLLVPHSGTAARAPQPAPSLHSARSSLSTTVASRRAQRTALWQDSSLFQDSFFAPDSRLDAFNSSDFAALSERSNSGRPYGGDRDELGGIVVDDAPPLTSRH